MGSQLTPTRPTILITWLLLLTDKHLERTTTTQYVSCLDKVWISVNSLVSVWKPAALTRLADLPRDSTRFAVKYAKGDFDVWPSQLIASLSCLRRSWECNQIRSLFISQLMPVGLKRWVVRAFLRSSFSPLIVQVSLQSWYKLTRNDCTNNKSLNSCILLAVHVFFFFF